MSVYVLFSDAEIGSSDYIFNDTIVVITIWNSIFISLDYKYNIWSREKIMIHKVLKN